MTTSSKDSSSMVSALGWFGIGLGVVEIVAPRLVARAAGLTQTSNSTLRLCGLREVVTGLAALSPQTAKAGLWGRVVGDVVDLALISNNLRAENPQTERLIAAAAAVLGVSAADLSSAMRFSDEDQVPVIINESTAINRSAQELYDYWRDLERLPEILSFIESVEQDDAKISRWYAVTPLGMSLSWKAEITHDYPGKVIAWRTLEDSDLSMSGSISFSPLSEGRGTAVTVRMEAYDVSTCGTISGWLGRISKHEVRKDLRRFKQLMELGEIVTTEGQPAGRMNGKTWLDAVASV